METWLLIALLSERESSTLAFIPPHILFLERVQRQVRILKDLLAFVNAWRRTEDFILVAW
jgi:hypothetical protein